VTSSLQKRSGIARVVGCGLGISQFTSTLMRLSTNGMNHIHVLAFDFSAEDGPHLLTLGGMEGWVGLGTTTVSKQSVQDRYVTNIAMLAVQTVTPHWTSGRTQLSHSCYTEHRGQTSNSWPLGSRAVALTTASLSQVTKKGVHSIPKSHFWDTQTAPACYLYKNVNVDVI